MVNWNKSKTIKKKYRSSQYRERAATTFEGANVKKCSPRLRLRPPWSGRAAAPWVAEEFPAVWRIRAGLHQSWWPGNGLLGSEEAGAGEQKPCGAGKVTGKWASHRLSLVAQVSVTQDQGVGTSGPERGAPLLEVSLQCLLLAEPSIALCKRGVHRPQLQSQQAEQRRGGLELRENKFVTGTSALCVRKLSAGEPLWLVDAKARVKLLLNKTVLLIMNYLLCCFNNKLPLPHVKSWILQVL